MSHSYVDAGGTPAQRLVGEGSQNYFRIGDHPRPWLNPWSQEHFSVLLWQALDQGSAAACIINSALFRTLVMSRQRSGATARSASSIYLVEQAGDILEKAQHLLATEHLVQGKIKAGAPTLPERGFHNYELRAKSDQNSARDRSVDRRPCIVPDPL